VDEVVLPALIRQSRAVSYPSRGEGFGMPVIEALACGAVVETSTNTVMSEIAGDAALLAGIGDADQLAGVLTTALAMNDAERAHFALRGRARAEEFTWDHCVAQHVKAYEMAARR
jgi:glycosyltransferase involved in cell wall biosynthesis